MDDYVKNRIFEFSASIRRSVIMDSLGGQNITEKKIKFYVDIINNELSKATNEKRIMQLQEIKIWLLEQQILDSTLMSS